MATAAGARCPPRPVCACMRKEVSTARGWRSLWPWRGQLAVALPVSPVQRRRRDMKSGRGLGRGSDIPHSWRHAGEFSGRWRRLVLHCWLGILFFVEVPTPMASLRSSRGEIHGEGGGGALQRGCGSLAAFGAAMCVCRNCGRWPRPDR
uniref:Uncharacterized protein n=1 Tax=Oryza punctata TaxID=4537 RepID=A0A0E0LQU5_ORYPU